MRVLEAMKDILDIQKQLLPDLLEVMNKRYTVMNHVMLLGTVGRRTLAASLDMTERTLRSEVDFLKKQGLLETDSNGIRIAETGRKLLKDMEPHIDHLFGLKEMEEKLRLKFGLRQVTVVAGDADISSITKSKLGIAGATAIHKFVAKDDVIAVTGGSTMAEIANWLTPSVQLKGNCFVPARGGLGESVELQANTIASDMAKKTGGQYRLLHVPDHLSEEAYQSLMQEPDIQEIIEVIRRVRIVVHGIGEAMHMAKRRRVDESTIHRLHEEGAVAEAFGYYFDKKGKVVHRMSTVGLRIEDIEQSQVVIAVAGGSSKAEAIAAIMRFGHEDVLITDEAAARGMLES